MHPTPERMSWLHLWLGECELAQNQQPLQARWHFRMAQRLTSPVNRCYGLAAYDSAIALFYEGAYADAADAFSSLLQPKKGFLGYDRRNCALWLRHAGVCAGYHADHAKLGIPEPPRLDPFCGAASLAACLRSLSQPYDRRTLQSVCRVTGEGSTFQDVLNAGRKLGLNTRSIKADDQGLMLLSKPLVAYVEQDHFVALVRADKKGVSYLCSDCGSWPGGRVDLTWAQWHALNPGLYVAVTKPGSAADIALQEALADPVPKRGKQTPLRLSYGGPLSGLHLGLHLSALSASALRGHVVRYNNSLTSNGCGSKFDSLHCLSYVQCPMYHPSAVGQGPQECDPVNLATGEEEYTPPPDLVVYNPHGPAVSWSRFYNSLRAPNPDGTTYQSNDFGIGWSHSYNIRIKDLAPTSPVSHPLQLIEPNGSSVGLTAAPPLAASSKQVCSFPAGTPFRMDWYNGPTAGYFFVMTMTDRSKWFFSTSISSVPSVYLLSQIQDRNGNSIYFNYYGPNVLAAITDQPSNGGNALLTITRNPDYTIEHVQDSFGHIVYYHVGNYSNTVPSTYQSYQKTYQELDNVSRVVQHTGTSTPPNPFTNYPNGGYVASASRWSYGYTDVANGEAGQAFATLTSITVPSPASTGGNLTPATSYINYGTYYVTSLRDANNNTTSFTAVDGTHTRVTVTDSSNRTVYSYTVGFDPNMSLVTKTDGSNSTIVLTKTYDPSSADPFRPVAVTNGNYTGGSSNKWQFVWDRYGNLHQMTSPRGTVTNYVWAFDPSSVPATINSVSLANAPILGELQSVTKGSKAPTTYTYFDASYPAGTYQPYYQDYTNSGLIKTVAAPLPGQHGVVNPTPSKFTYTSFGDIQTMVTPGNNAATTKTTTFIYDQDPGDGAHNIPAFSQLEMIGQPLTVTDNLNHVTHYRYDPNGQGFLTQMFDALGFETDYSYNDATNNLNEAASSFGQIQQVTYPATSQTGAGRSRTNYQYLYPGGPLTSMLRYDESGNLIRQVNYRYGNEGEPLSVTGSTEPVAHAYDALYRPVLLQDGNGHSTTYSYNAAGYLASILYPANTGGYDSLQFTYDAAGNMVKRIDGNGVETDFQHSIDPESLLTQMHYVYPTGYTGTQIGDVSLSYDAYSRPVTMTDGTGSTTYGIPGNPGAASYDDLDNPIQIQASYSGSSASYSLSYQYWPDSSRQTMSLSTPIWASSHSYYYDGGGRLTQMVLSHGASAYNPSYQETTAWSYYPNNWLQSQLDGNGLQTSYQYNQLGQLIDLHSQVGSTLVADFGMPTGGGYDGAGNRLSVTANMPPVPAYNGTTTYSYDYGQTANAAASRDQLTQESTTRNGGSYPYVYGYDTAGNPTSMRGVPNPGYSADNQTTTPAGINPAFLSDGNGNPGASRGRALTFDPENRMTQAADQAGGISTAISVNSGANTDNILRLLATNNDGSLSLQNVRLSDGGVSQVSVTGPYPDWTPNTVAVGGDNVPHVLWNRADGEADMSGFNASGNYQSGYGYGPFPGWSAVTMAVGPDGFVYILWSHAPDNACFYYRINPSTGQAVQSPTPTTAWNLPAGWSATAITVDASNHVHLLLNNVNGQVAHWVDTMPGPPPGFVYTPAAGWTGKSLSAGPPSDPRVRMMLAHTDGAVLTLILNADNSGAASPIFGPITGYMPVNLTMDGYGVGRILWSKPNGDNLILNILPDNATASVLTTMTAPHVPGTGLSSGFRGDGLRAWKQNDAGAKTFFVYDGSDPICELDSSGNAVALNSFGEAGLISRRAVANNTSTFYAFDERGNVAERLSNGGGVATADLYDAFGRRLAGYADVWGFGAQAGYYSDPETGLSLLTNRFYDPQAGRFLTRDPMGYGGGINLYSYVANNPINYLDPLGFGDDSGPTVWQDALSGFNVGLNATASALSFNLYNGGDARCDPDFGTSKKLAGYGRDALIMAATAGTGETAVAAEESAEVATESAAEGAGEDVAEACLRCFTAETRVQMADGTTKAISEVQVGDQVRSRDPQTGQESAKTVTATIKRQASAVVTVSLTDAKTGTVETLTCTPEHPLYVQGQGWVEAGSLGIGSSIVSRAGPALSVASVTWHRNQTNGNVGAEKAAGSGGMASGGTASVGYTVYNLTVEEDHTYFVGTVGGGTWVHNNTCYLTHGTSIARANKILENGFKPGYDGAVFFGEDYSTAEAFGRMGGGRAVLSFRVPSEVYEEAGMQRGLIGEYRDAPFLDIDGGSGYEHILEGPGVSVFNKALADGTIEVSKLGRW